MNYATRRELGVFFAAVLVSFLSFVAFDELTREPSRPVVAPTPGAFGHAFGCRWADELEDAANGRGYSDYQRTEALRGAYFGLAGEPLPVELAEAERVIEASIPIRRE